MLKRSGTNTKAKTKISLTGAILSALCLLNNGIRHTTIVNAKANHRIKIDSVIQCWMRKFIYDNIREKGL